MIGQVRVIRSYLRRTNGVPKMKILKPWALHNAKNFSDWNCLLNNFGTCAELVVVQRIYYYYYQYPTLGLVWQEPEVSQATGMALVRCILGKFLGVVCHCFPPENLKKKKKDICFREFLIVCNLVNKTNRCIEFQFYWYYNSAYFGQPFCPSSVLSCTSAFKVDVRLRTHDDGQKGCLKHAES
jgi:hypothetical protein